MASAPVEIGKRPYSIAVPTNMMSPDGFFVVNMGDQWIEASITNTSHTDLEGVRVYIEGLSDPGVTRTHVIRDMGTVPAGASFPVRFLADFTTASPSVSRVSFVIEADGFQFRRQIKKIFVTRVDYHKPSKTYSVITPQGTMRVKVHSAIVGPRSLQDCKRDAGAFLALLKDVSYEWVPSPPYEGVHCPFPYEDPWLKIALWILAGLLLAGALLYDYFDDGDLDGGFVSVSGTFEETDPSASCCTSVSTSASEEGDWLERSLYTSAGAAATLAIASDGPDLHYRGQEATPPDKGEWTLGELVRLKIDYLEPPNPGTRFPIAAEWRYTRTTDAKTYEFGASDRRENLHWLNSYDIVAPSLYDRLSGPLTVKGRFMRPDGEPYRSDELYVGGILVSTYGVARRFAMADHGMGLDEEAGDGWYTGGYIFGSANFSPLMAATHPPDPEEASKSKKELDLPGIWYLFVIAQDVNTVPEGTDPFKAAHTIGGVTLTTQLELGFDKPCKLAHDAVIQVV